MKEMTPMSTSSAPIISNLLELTVHNKYFNRKAAIIPFQSFCFLVEKKKQSKRQTFSLAYFHSSWSLQGIPNATFLFFCVKKSLRRKARVKRHEN
jgi:hypothetical protein